MAREAPQEITQHLKSMPDILRRQITGDFRHRQTLDFTFGLKTKQTCWVEFGNFFFLTVHGRLCVTPQMHTASWDSVYYLKQLFGAIEDSFDQQHREVWQQKLCEVSHMLSGFSKQERESDDLDELALRQQQDALQQLAARCDLCLGELREAFVMPAAKSTEADSATIWLLNLSNIFLPFAIQRLELALDERAHTITTNKLRYWFNSNWSNYFTVDEPLSHPKLVALSAITHAQEHSEFQYDLIKCVNFLEAVRQNLQPHEAFDGLHIEKLVTVLKSHPVYEKQQELHTGPVALYEFYRDMVASVHNHFGRLWPYNPSLLSHENLNSKLIQVEKQAKPIIDDECRQLTFELNQLSEDIKKMAEELCQLTQQKQGVMDNGVHIGSDQELDASCLTSLRQEAKELHVKLATQLLETRKHKLRKQQKIFSSHPGIVDCALVRKIHENFDAALQIQDISSNPLQVFHDWMKRDVVKEQFCTLGEALQQWLQGVFVWLNLYLARLKPSSVDGRCHNLRFFKPHVLASELKLRYSADNQSQADPLESLMVACAA